jgi:hypothetical protein
MAIFNSYVKLPEGKPSIHMVSWRSCFTNIRWLCLKMGPMHYAPPNAYSWRKRWESSGFRSSRVAYFWANPYHEHVHTWFTLDDFGTTPYPRSICWSIACELPVFPAQFGTGWCRTETSIGLQLSMSSRLQDLSSRFQQDQFISQTALANSEIIK